MTATRLPSSALPEPARLFQALSGETRLAILDLLQGGERCVEAGLVTDRKVGR